VSTVLLTNLIAGRRRGPDAQASLALLFHAHLARPDASIQRDVRQAVGGHTGCGGGSEQGGGGTGHERETVAF